MSPRALVSLALSAALASAGCTSTATVAPRARYALARTTGEDFVRLPTDDGGSVVFGPNATLHVDGSEGIVDVSASDLYSTEEGLIKSTGEPVSTWDGLVGVKVEQIDGAATAAVTATVAIVVIGIAALLKSAPSGGSKSSSPRVSGSARPPAVRSAPTPRAVDPDPAVTEVLFRTAEAVASTPDGNVTVATPDVQPEPSSAIPLFSRGARRRAHVRVLARLEGGACWPGGGPNGDCIASGARAGVRLVDLIELSGGVRLETSGPTTRPYAVFGGVIHGELPAAHWLALGVGANVAFDGVRTHVVPEISVRFRPARGLWLGLVPIAPMYRTEDGTWLMTSGVELTGEL